MGFWEGQRVVVTGGTGFLGRAVVRRLRTLGCQDVRGLGSRDYDLRDDAQVAKLYVDARPTLVIHLAAVVGGIGANRARPAEFFYDNLMMGAQLVHHAWRARLPKLVIAGTVCAYPKLTAVPFREDALWDGYPEETNAPYGLAKKALLVQAQAYRQQYGLNAIYLLPSNLYGPGDNFDPRTSHVIPALIRRCAEAVEHGQSSLDVWGDGSATREFLYVDDAVDGLLLAAERYDDEAPINLGTGEEISIRHVAERVAALTGFTGELVWDPTKPNGQPRRRLDVSRAAEHFGFRARTAFADGLQRTVEWYLGTRATTASASSAS